MRVCRRGWISVAFSFVLAAAAGLGMWIGPARSAARPQPIEQETVTPVPTATEPITPTEPVTSAVFLPAAWDAYRPQTTELGLAFEGFFNESGYPLTLQLNYHLARRWRWISWEEVEPEEGEYRWDALAGLEQELLRAKAESVEPYLSIQMTPYWAQATPPHECGAIRPDKYERFAAFVEELVRRYGTRSIYGVRYWQIGNEPDIDPDVVGGESPFGCWGNFDDEFYGGGAYGDMLKVLYPRVKAADPGALIVAGGLQLECNPYDWEAGKTCINEDRLRAGLFLEGMLRAGAADAFDILSVHSYGWMDLELPSRMRSQYGWNGEENGIGLRQKVTFVRDLLARYGYPDKPILAGESALRCSEPGPACELAGAAYIPRLFAEVYGLDLVGGIYYALITEYHYKGLLLEDLSVKPQFYAYRFLGSQLRDTHHTGPVTDYAGVEGQAFAQPGIRRLQIVWSQSGYDQTIALPEGFRQAFDVFGNPVEPDAGRLTIGWSPIYIELSYSRTPL